MEEALRVTKGSKTTLPTQLPILPPHATPPEPLTIPSTHPGVILPFKFPTSSSVACLMLLHNPSTSPSIIMRPRGLAIPLASC